MTTPTIRKKLHNYIDAANDKKLKAIYTILEKEIETKEDDWDDHFAKEINRRSKEMKSGMVKTYTWDEMEKAARKIIQSKRKR